MKHKTLLIVGTRPNLVKAAPVCKALMAAGSFEPIVVHTGQHYDAALSGDFFEELSLPHPTHSLCIGSGRQAWQLGEMIARLDAVFVKQNPAAVLVFGDTNSTAAGAIAAAKNNVLLGHVEAGLREWDKSIPEEVNKLLISAVADLHFCPTPTGLKNLALQGITQNAHLVGDVGIDLIFNNLDKIRAMEEQVLQAHGLQEKQYIFATCHRAANTGERDTLLEILAALDSLPLPVIFPMHPRTKKALEDFGLPVPPGNVPPLGFFETQALIRNAAMAITDSGGVIKEAYFHKTPGIIVDRQTEWVETVEEGWNVVVGPSQERILKAVAQNLVAKFRQHSNCLGEGTASEKIARILASAL